MNLYHKRSRALDGGKRGEALGPCRRGEGGSKGQKTKKRRGEKQQVIIFFDQIRKRLPNNRGEGQTEKGKSKHVQNSWVIPWAGMTV